MRGLRGLAGALALVVLAGEARSQHYPYNPYPQPNPYGYGSPYQGGYYNGNPFYNGGPPQAYYPPSANAPYASQYYPAAAAQPPSGGQGLVLPIFPQSSLEQPAPENRYLSPSAAAVQSPAPPPPLPPAAVPLPVPAASERPLVIQPLPANAPTFPRSLPSDPKADAAVLPDGDAKREAPKDDDAVPETKKPAKAEDAAEGPAANAQTPDKPLDPVPLPGAPAAEKKT